MNMVLTLAALVDLLKEGLGGLWSGASLLLVSAPFTPANNLTMTGITEASFTGYARKAVTWGTPGFDPSSGQAEAVGTGTYQWLGPSDTSGQLIYGIILLQPGATGPPVVPETVLYSALFPAPLPMQVPTDPISVSASAGVAGFGTVSVLS